MAITAQDLQARAQQSISAGTGNAFAPALPTTREITLDEGSALLDRARASAAAGTRNAFAPGVNIVTPTATTPTPDSTITTSAETPFIDMVTPTVSQDVLDQNFINSLGGKTFGQMTAQEIQQLMDIYTRNTEAAAGQTLTDAYGTQIGQATSLEGELAQQLADLQLSEEERVAAEIANAIALLGDTYAPQFSQLERQGERAIEDIQRSFSFSGTGRGTRAQEKRNEQLEIQAEAERALAAEQALQERLLIAQIQGESDEKISAIQDQLDAATATRRGLETDLAAAQAELTATLGTLGQESMTGLLEQLQAQASLNAYDPTLSQATGQIVDSQGNSIINPATGEPFEFYTTESVPGLDDALSAQIGYLVDENRNAITDDQGNAIPYTPGVQGFTKIGDSIAIIRSDGSYELIQGVPVAQTGLGSSGTTITSYDPENDAVYSDIAQYAYENGVSYTQAVDDLGYGTSLKDRQALINGTASYVNMIAATPSKGGVGNLSGQPSSGSTSAQTSTTPSSSIFDILQGGGLWSLLTK